MEAILVDRAEPSESLTCNTVYALGLPENTDYSQTPSKGVRGAFIAHSLIHSFTHSLTPSTFFFHFHLLCVQSHNSGCSNMFCSKIAA